MKLRTAAVSVLLLFCNIVFIGAQEKSSNAQAELYCQKGDEAFITRKYDQAITLYSKSIQLDNKYPDAYFKRGICYVKTERYTEAVDDFNNFLTWADNTYRNKDSVRSIIISLGGVPVN